MYCMNVTLSSMDLRASAMEEMERENRLDAGPSSHPEGTGTISDPISLAIAKLMPTSILSRIVEASL